MNMLDRLRVSQWHVGLIRRPIEELLDGYRDREIEWLHITPEARVAADPFGLVRNGRLHVFFEFRPYGQLDAFIAHVEIGPNGRPSRARPVLKLSHHLSYPFLFEHLGDLYMIPESAQAGQVMLFRCTQFPDCWEKVAVILPGVRSVDNTVFRHAGLWWLFAACGEGSTELHLWWSETPLGLWRPHPRNPVKTDPGSTRPAGTPFTRNGELFRPAMDNAADYGRRIVLNHVTALSPDEFSEEPVTRLEPDPGSFCPQARHTLSAAGDFTLTDGARQTFTVNPAKLIGRLRTSAAFGAKGPRRSYDGE
jgi:hypothetical protein